MWAFLLVALGSALGGVARYAAALWVNPRATWAWGWPVGTLLVNVLGCFLLSLVNEGVLRGFPLRPELRLLITTGFCGGFTTYSTFNHETVKLFEERSWAGVGYGLATVLCCLGAHAVAVGIAHSLAGRSA